VEYRFEIYASDGRVVDDCVKVFVSSSPFPPVQVGDLLDASTWGHTGSRSLRILSVEHSIIEKSPLGIDPSGRIINRTLVHTRNQ
jgi:hypothetical protein